MSLGTDRETVFDEKQWYSKWESSLVAYNRIVVHFGFTAKHFERLLKHLEIRNEESDRILAFDESTRAVFLQNISKFRQWVAFTNQALDQLWEEIYNSPDMDTYFLCDKGESPLLWSNGFGVPQVNDSRIGMLSQKTEQLIARYCFLQKCLSQFLLGLRLKREYLEDLVERVELRINKYLNYQVEAMLLKKLCSEYPKEHFGFFHEQMTAVCSTLQVEHSAFRMFPGDYSFFLNGIHTHRKQIAKYRTKIFEGKSKLVGKIAPYYISMSRQLSVVSATDIIQEGYIGLLEALDRYDYRMGHRFESYATPWIRNSIMDLITSCRGAARLPGHQAKCLSKIKKYEEKFAKEHCVEPDDKTIAKEFGMSVDTLQRVRQTVATARSLDAPVYSESGETLGDSLEDTESIDPLKEAEGSDMKSFIEPLLDELPEHIKDCVIRYFGLRGREPESLEIIGKDYGVGREAIRLRLESAYKKLYHAIPVEERLLYEDG